MLRRAVLTTSLLLTIAGLAACGSDSANTTSTGSPEVPTTTIPATMPSTPITTLASTTSTAPGPGTGDLLVIGDWGSGTAPQGAVAGAMQRYAEDHPVWAILTTGDNFYSDDAAFLMAPYDWVEAAGIDWWITWGNHDVESESRIDLLIDTFHDPPRWTVYPWGDIDVIILDSNQVNSLDQASFLVSALSTSSKPTIVALHHPPFSCSHHGATVELSRQVVDVFDDDVVLVLSGHDHNYQRFEHDEISYVVSGGGGRTLYDIEECPANHPELVAGAELHHFLSLTRDRGDSVTVSVLDVNGAIVDQFSVDLG